MYGDLELGRIQLLSLEKGQDIKVNHHAWRHYICLGTFLMITFFQYFNIHLQSQSPQSGKHYIERVIPTQFDGVWSKSGRWLKCFKDRDVLKDHGLSKKMKTPISEMRHLLETYSQVFRECSWLFSLLQVCPGKMMSDVSFVTPLG